MSVEKHPVTGRPVPQLHFWLDGGYDRYKVEECEYHPDHQWTVIRVIDAKPEHRDPEERMAICKGCFVPRCGYTTEPNPCMLPRHHPERHLYADGSMEPNDVWPGSEKPDPPAITLVPTTDQNEGAS